MFVATVVHVQLLMHGSVATKVVKFRARLHHKLGQPERAAGLLEDFVRRFADDADLTHVNILAELYMEAGRFAEAAALISQAEARLGAGAGALPVDLTVRHALGASRP